ncbi:hypothetical protein F3Y22_tig00112231pilonHSYRG00051 [Hibiscus syriacus]|uniref:RNase H type-1 domain-containing protein n=1 Tax=Hibiscus syriacus TaxID=106335 RepID=A0A6A2YB16_HIBSY|nr:hypothetical protein F3Y22_tig00112231pilonHSYRG00051 [Hibiscus syriacus]
MDPHLKNLSLVDDKEKIIQFGENQIPFRVSFEKCFDRKWGSLEFQYSFAYIHGLKNSEDPLTVQVNWINYWILVHDLPHGFMSDHAAKQLENFIDSFVEYDSFTILLDYKRMMHIQFRVNIRQPLKRKKKFALLNGAYAYAHFEYEKLTLFCFMCGCLGYGEDGRGGGLSIGWEENCKVSLRSYSQRHIDVLINDDSDGKTWRCIGFYSEPEIRGFSLVLSDCELLDLGYIGQWLTWERGHSSTNNIRECLDKRVANNERWDLFPTFKLEHLAHYFYDHCPLLVHTYPKGVSPYISDDINNSLLRPYTHEEVYETLKTMSPLKAAGDDGLGIVTSTRSFGKEFGSIALARTSNATPPPTAWSPPINLAKINVDAGSTLKKATFGVVTRDEFAHILGSCCQIQRSVSSIFMAEAVAALNGLQFAKYLGLSRVILENDSKSIIIKLQSGVDDSSVIRSIIWDIHCLCKTFKEKAIEWRMQWKKRLCLHPKIILGGGSSTNRTCPGRR